MTTLPFIKMHGAGNDFIVIDNRALGLKPTRAQVVRLADRRYGIGCDQLVLMEPARQAHVFMRIYNADGGEVGACGNATRCVGWRLMNETGKKEVTVETATGLLQCTRAGEKEITVDMGKPKLAWNEIPLAEKKDTLHLGIGIGPLFDPVAVSMGNPHAVFFVDNAESVPLEQLGPVMEHHELFPERTNVSVAEIQGDSNIHLRVWERGTGITLACGTAACATLVAASLRNLVNNKATIHLPGGRLTVEWPQRGHVLMTGPVAVAFEGTVVL